MIFWGVNADIHHIQHVILFQHSITKHGRKFCISDALYLSSPIFADKKRRCEIVPSQAADTISERYGMT